MTIFFTSDQHFGHANIMKYCNRPFSSTEEMDETMIERHNKVVKPKDLVFMLGDFAFYGRGNDAKAKVVSILKRLNGDIAWLPGNHDPYGKESIALGTKVVFIKDITELRKGKDFPENTVLCHYPMLSWNRSFHGSYHLHGHCHGTIPFDPKVRRLDVGVDIHNFTPISIEEIHVKLQAVPTPRELVGTEYDAGIRQD